MYDLLLDHSITSFFGLILVGFILGILGIVEYSKFHQFFTTVKATFEKTGADDKLHIRTKKYIELESVYALELERNSSFGRLSNAIFHDLMNHISGITLYLESALEKGADLVSTQDALSKITTMAKKMNSFMSEVKNCINTNKSHDVGNSVVDAINTISDLYNYELKKSNISVDFEYSEDILVETSNVYLNQLLMNLFSNSIHSLQKTKFRRRKINISITKDPQYSTITFEDNGIGFKKEQAQKAFKESFTTKEGGSGLGLMTIRDIVQNKLNGTVFMDQNTTRGCRTRIVFPKLPSKVNITSSHSAHL